ncbi:MAG: J domain-containing protein [Deltaproteobacteria bacterium]|nr:J domain-containing protein [Deltaproteobacteria bacterium]
MPRNPFEIFGLTPELVAELSDRELFGVLKSMYRSLQKTFHPDIAGRRKAKAEPGPGARQAAQKAARPVDRAVELNLAFEALDLDKDPASFRRLRKVYAARRPASAYQNALVLKDRLRAQMEKEERLAQSFLSYLADNAFNGKVVDENRLAVPLPARGVNLGLSDVAISNNIRQAAWFLGSNYKHINVDAQGQISVKPVGRSRFAKANFIHLLGSVPVESIDLTPILERGQSQSFKSPALAPGESANAKMSVLNLISSENFKRHVLPLLKPYLMERAYLFSFNNDMYKDLDLITLEGVIIKLERT